MFPKTVDIYTNVCFIHVLIDLEKDGFGETPFFHCYVAEHKIQGWCECLKYDNET